MIEIPAIIAEKIVGEKIDKRKKYAVNDDGKPCEANGNYVFVAVKWSSACSGCCDDSEYSSPYRGGGCQECGYTGRVRSGMWVPF